METRDLAAELAEALDMLFQVATDPRSRLPRTELYTDMALNDAYTALKRAEAAGLLLDGAGPYH
jgi:hypothetical protein